MPERFGPIEWFAAAPDIYERTWASDGRLSSLPAEWQRELVALWRLDNEVNNGGYIQFFVNCGREYYAHASQVLKKIGADKTAAIVDSCQALIDEHFLDGGASADDLAQLLPGPLINTEGKRIKDAGSVLPDSAVARLSELSYEYMSYPDDCGYLAEDYFREYLANK